MQHHMILALLWTQMFVTATFAYRLCSPYSMFCLSALSVPFPFPPFPLYMLFIEAHGMPGKQCEEHLTLAGRAANRI